MHHLRRSHYGYNIATGGTGSRRLHHVVSVPRIDTSARISKNARLSNSFSTPMLAAVAAGPDTDARPVRPSPARMRTVECPRAPTHARR